MKSSDGKVFAFIDTNWLINRAYSVFRTRENCDRMVIKQVIGWACEYAIRLRATHMCLCIDGDNVFRHRVYSEYKANRTKDRVKGEHSSVNHQVDDPVIHSNPAYSCLSELKERLTEMALPWEQKSELEADDLLVSGAYRFGKRSKVYLVTLDKDVNQAVVGNVLKYMPAVGANGFEKFVTEAALLHDMEPGLAGTGLTDYQTLIGDGTDGIPRLMSPAKAKVLLHEHGSLRNYVEKTKEGKRYWEARQEELIRNRTLVRLLPKAWEPDEDELKLRVPENTPSYAPRAWHDLMGVLGNKKKSLF